MQDSGGREVPKVKAECRKARRLQLSLTTCLRDAFRRFFPHNSDRPAPHTGQLRRNLCMANLLAHSHPLSACSGLEIIG